jgi:toluene monooxygenase system ferredoxin subunit
MGETLAQQWHEVMHIDELRAGDMKGHEVAGHQVLLINLDGRVLAYQDRCPHQGWPLHRGLLEGEELTCINHLWTFDVPTGQGINNPANCSLVQYPCKVNEDGTVLVSVD